MPRLTVRRMMIGVAAFAVLLSAILAVPRAFNYLVFEPGTVYAPGYDATRFAQVRPGMTEAQVKALVGPPATVWTWSASAPEPIWAYTTQQTPLSNFRRRWVIFEWGRVREVVSDNWID